MPALPHVSVIVPVYNGALTIGRALDSVYAQSLADFEIIVVDDGSTDETVSIVGSRGRDRLQLLRHSDNRGAAAARNTGIAAARGRLIAFLDSDDSWKPDKLARQVAVFDLAEPKTRGCATGYALHKDGRELTISLNLLPEEFSQEILFGCTISPGTTLMTGRDVFAEIGLFDEEFRRLEDWDWLLRFSKRYDMAFVPEPLADVYLTTTKRLPAPAGVDPVAEAIRRIGAKHLPRTESWLQWMQLQSSLLVERAAAFHRKGNAAAAALYVVAALVVYPARNVAFFRTLLQAVKK